MWVANPLAGTVTQVAVDRAAVVRTIAMPGIPRSIAAADGRVWVSLSNLGTAPTPGNAEVDVQGLPAASCGPVVYGGQGRPDVLIASELMLQGGTRVTTTQMAQAIEFVLRQHRFRAGGLRVAYQSCDDSIATTGIRDLAKCAANARAYAANPRVVGVIGAFISDCSAAQLPILNRAPGGGVAMVSPSNTLAGLTRAGPGAPAEELAALYPTGRRTYVRVINREDVQMAALALTARRLGHRRVALLDDGAGWYGVPHGLEFADVARRVGLRVVFHESWSPGAGSYRGLVHAVRRSRPQAVVLIGLADTNIAQVVRELRTGLGPSVALLGAEGSAPIGLLLRRSGGAARGMYVALNGLTVERLPPRGLAFVRAFAATQPGAEIQATAVYAAQATEVLLRAIGRSNGTRASVVRELLRTRIADGLLGEVAFDANGDLTHAPVTIVRVTGTGGTSNTILSHEGAEIVRVERPSGLVR